MIFTKKVLHLNLGKENMENMRKAGQSVTNRRGAYRRGAGEDLCKGWHT